ncbi:MAG: DUF2339 domain-containing protein [Salinivirgaceae bacterium]|nr:DUF2339 domain-containing protein [Salinivirgaceae bacterium]
MTNVTFLIVAAILIFLLALNSFIRKYIKQQGFEIKSMQKTLEDIKMALNRIEDKYAKITSSIVEKEPEVSIPIKAVFEEKTHFETVVESHAEDRKVEPVGQVFKNEPRPIVAPKEKYPKQIKKSFSERFPDLEKFIGENLINKIGIVILVMGLGFFVKYAIDKDWINEIGRVAIGILSAAGLLGLAHKLQKDYKSFSSVLVGGGLALLYFTITLAYHTKGYPFYEQQTITFLILTLITIFGVVLSIGYNRVEIAILAILGGFGAPLMVSNGSGNYIILFSYLMLLNIGMLVLSYYKKWRLVNIVSFACTMLLFASWLINELIAKNHAAFSGAIFFATGFYIIFFLMNIIYNLKHKISFKVGDISLILANTFIYFTFVMIMLSYISNGEYKGLFAILLGIFNFAFAFYIHTRKKEDTNLLFLLIGLVLTFVTLSIPLQLQGNYITLFWAVEGVLLLWLSQKSGFKVMKLASVLVTVLMLISLIMDWSINYDTLGFYDDGYVKQLGIIFNKIFITSIISGAALLGSFILLKREKERIAYFIPVRIYQPIILGLMFVVFYVVGLLEVNYQSYHYFIESSSKAIALFTFNSLFVLILLTVARKLNFRNFSIVVAAIATFFILVFLSALSNDFINSIYHFIDEPEVHSSILLAFRWVSIISVYVSGIFLLKLVNTLNASLKNTLYKFNVTFFVFTLVYLLSADLDAISLLISKNVDVVFQTQKLGYAVLWGISSFLLMIIGMKMKEKFVRILSLALFAITIIKLFVYDISNLSEGGKIIAFILLGVLLLIISFMYQKVRKLVIDNEMNDEAEKIISND